jgi:hypothetical protein
VGEALVNYDTIEWADAVTKVREVGSIAGTTPVGLGRLVANFKEPNDGTVAVAETKLPGLKDHLCMAHSHSTMVVAKDAADQVVAFLQRGEFVREI